MIFSFQLKKSLAVSQVFLVLITIKLILKLHFPICLKSRNHTHCEINACECVINRSNNEGITCPHYTCSNHNHLLPPRY